MSFIQAPPVLKDPYATDRVLQGYLRANLKTDKLPLAAKKLEALSTAILHDLQPAARAQTESEPQLMRWDAWGKRIDKVSITPRWRAARRIAASHGIITTAYEADLGAEARTVQFALAYLFAPASGFYGCPLAMSDGAARTLIESGNEALIDRAIPSLLERDPNQVWTSGQWMTESTGGSDLSGTQTIARPGADGNWLLYGRKWFASAPNSEMALALARPTGNPKGADNLALFYIEPRDAAGQLQNIEIIRLKQKLGTRELPTAELELNGVPATLVRETHGGIKALSPMLNITRTWNSVTAVGLMRRGMMLFEDYAKKRQVFSTKLANKPLHTHSFCTLQSEFESAFHLVFFSVKLLGEIESGNKSNENRQFLRLLTAITKLYTAKICVPFMSEILEGIGGVGYLEDSGLPALLRDAQVLPIWEGTTNIMALESLKSIQSGVSLQAYLSALHQTLAKADHPDLIETVRETRRAASRTAEWLQKSTKLGQSALESGAREFAMSLARCLSLALLCKHATWACNTQGDKRPLAAARLFATRRLCTVANSKPDLCKVLLQDKP